MRSCKNNRHFSDRAIRIVLCLCLSVCLSVSLSLALVEKVKGNKEIQQISMHHHFFSELHCKLNLN